MIDETTSLLLSRRRLLVAAACGALAPSVVSATRAGALGVVPTHTLVVVFLRGGLDGLSALVPVSESEYFDIRPTIAIGVDEVVPLDSRFGLHPALAGLQPSWDAGHLALVPAVGSNFTSRSHFDQQEFMEGGGRMGGSGWIARHLHSRPEGPAAVLDAIALSNHVTASMRGATNSIASRHITRMSLDGWRSDVQSIARDSLEASYAGSPDMLTSSTVAALFDALDRLETADPESVVPSVPYPSNSWAASLGDVAALITSGIAPDVVTMDFGGWDTHDDMGTAAGGRMAGLLERLGSALGAFAADLGDAMDRVTVVVQSEFGRRAIENGNGGVDHGRGGLMMLLGNRVAGGVRGDWPTLTASELDRGALAMANDYRDVLGDIVVNLLGNPAVGEVFPDHLFEATGVVA